MHVLISIVLYSTGLVGLATMKMATASDTADSNTLAIHQTWPLRVGDTRRLEAFDHWCLRRILKADWHGKLSNNKTRRRSSDVEKLSAPHATSSPAAVVGHVLRRPATEA